MDLAQLSFAIDFDSFHDFLVDNVPNADGLVTTANGYTVIEKNIFSTTDIDNVNTYYNSLTQSGELAKMGSVPLQTVARAITNAGSFGSQLTVQYASSNVLQGITVNGNTQPVADYLKNLAYYLHNGSLYAAIAEMNVMIADTSTTKTSLSPYVTNDLLYSYMNQIEDWLNIPLTPNPGS